MYSDRFLASLFKTQSIQIDIQQTTEPENECLSIHKAMPTHLKKAAERLQEILTYLISQT
ncbi:hypothetical protein DWX23_23500 [Parabacteroides sp. AF18-52]|nr:hypothetical protein DWX23_23500 [Parabacteroides sp. AF18-52]